MVGKYLPKVSVFWNLSQDMSANGFLSQLVIKHCFDGNYLSEMLKEFMPYFKLWSKKMFGKIYVNSFFLLTFRTLIKKTLYYLSNLHLVCFFITKYILQVSTYLTFQWIFDIPCTSTAIFAIGLVQHLEGKCWACTAVPLLPLYLIIWLHVDHIKSTAK